MTRLEKILNNLDSDTIADMQGASPEALRGVLVGAEKSIANTKQQLEDCPQYQDTKENLKALTQGYRDVKKRQTAKIQYALILLEEKGE